MSELDCLFRSMSRWPAALAERFGQEVPPLDRARALAALLRESVGCARWAACRLGDAHAASPEDHANARTLHFDGAGDGAGVQPLDGGGWAAPFSSGLGVDGVLAVALADDAPAELARGAEALLALAAPLVGLHLQAEARLREEREAHADIATVGDAVMGLAHELNNHLNTMMLQASVVQIEVDESLGEELAVIRREGMAVAARLRLLQDFRARSRLAAVPVDLHALLRRAAALVPALQGRARWRLADGLPAIVANYAGLLRLLSSCLRLVADRAPDGPVSIRSEQREQTVRIALGPLPGLPVAEHLAELFSSEENPRHDRVMQGLAAESLARLVEVRWRLEEGDLVLEWPQCPRSRRG